MRLTYCCVFLLFSFLVNGQSDLGYTNYTTKDGLGSNTIFSIFQDSLGYLYIGHNKGMNKFNGRAFLRIGGDENVKALSNFTYWNHSALICRNFHGQIFSIHCDSIKEIDLGLNESGGFPTFFRSEVQLYVFHNDQLAEIEKDGKTVKMPFPLTHKFSQFWSVFISGNLIYYSMSYNGAPIALVYDKAAFQVIHKQVFEQGDKIRLFSFKDEIIWMNLKNGAVGGMSENFPLYANVFERIGEDFIKITDVMEMPDGRILMATFNGIYLFNDQWQLEGHFLDAIQCSTLLVDQDNSLWVGSLQNGLYHIESLDLIKVSVESLPGKNVKFSAALKNDNTIFVGTYDGRIFEFDEAGVLKQTFELDNTIEVESMAYHNNTLWVYCGGLYSIDCISGEITFVQDQMATKCISVSSTGDTLVLGTSKGIRMISEEGSFSSLDTLWMKHTRLLKNNELLLESSRSIEKYNLKTKNSIKISLKGSDLCEYQGRYFFKEGRSIFEIENNESVLVKECHAIPDRLFANEKGLFIISESEQIQQILPESNWSFNVSSEFSLEDVLYFTTIGESYFIVNPDAFLIIPTTYVHEQTLPQLHLIQQSGNFTIEDSVFQLPFGNNNLTLVFDLLPNLSDKGKGKIKYRIPALDSVWTNALEKEHYTIEILRIPSGNYCLEIQGYDLMGQTTPVMQYALHVASPFYFKWWFVLVLFSLILLVGSVIFKWRANLIRQKNKRDLEKQRLKWRALNSELTAIRAQMNPHFIFNSLSSIQTKILKEDRVAAYENLSIFAVLLRQALQFTSQEFISLEDEMAFIRNYIALEQFRNEEAFTYEEHCDEGVHLKHEKVPSLILQPFIENAIRHGLMHRDLPRMLRIEITKSPQLTVSIWDNGIGREASAKINLHHRAKHKSFATKAIKERIDILAETGKMNIDLNIHDLEVGTQVVIQFKPYE